MLFTETLKNNRDFLFLYKNGRTVAGKYAVVYFCPNGRPVSRLGITTGKKIGIAVERVRARRVIRAAYSAAEGQLPIGFDMVIAARTAAVHACPADIERFLTGAVLNEMDRHFDFRPKRPPRKRR